MLNRSSNFQLHISHNSHYQHLKNIPFCTCCKNLNHIQSSIEDKTCINHFWNRILDYTKNNYHRIRCYNNHKFESNSHKTKKIKIWSCIVPWDTNLWKCTHHNLNLGSYLVYSLLCTDHIVYKLIHIIHSFINSMIHIFNLLKCHSTAAIYLLQNSHCYDEFQELLVKIIH